MVDSVDSFVKATYMYMYIMEGDSVLVTVAYDQLYRQSSTLVYKPWQSLSLVYVEGYRSMP